MTTSIVLVGKTTPWKQQHIQKICNIKAKKSCNNMGKYADDLVENWKRNYQKSKMSEEITDCKDLEL